MGSRSPSEDEGEIVESKTSNMTKATTARPAYREPRVNRRASYSSDSSSSSRVSDRPYSRDRSRSRSPFRHDAAKDDRSPRNGVSDRSRNDPRHFNVHYEDKHRHRDDVNRHDGSSYRDGQRNRDPYDEPRHRKRTLSPERRERNRDTKRSRHEVSERAPRPGETEKKGKLNGFVSPREYPSPASPPSSLNKTQGSRASQKQPGFASRIDARPEKGVSGGASGDRATNNDSKTVKFSDSSKPPADDAPQKEAEPVDEMTEIERRRKRREAILAKHKSQSSSLLVQALEQGSEISTPKSPSVSQTRSGTSTKPTGNYDKLTNQVSPASIPATPNNVSAPGSPASFTIETDQDLANRVQTNPGTPNTDDSSAADYDPLIDMQEDRARHDPILRSTEVSASAYDETKAETHDILMSVPESVVHEDHKPAGDGFDMFAEDADDDMFAAAPAKPAHRHAQVSTVSQEQDTNLMDNWDDPDGYYRITLHEVLDGRYRVTANLGKGMFSGVVRAEDSQTNRLVAIKVIRNNETMRKAGMKEIGILQNLAEADPDNKKNVIRLERHFDHRGHLCMVFENLSINLREVLKKFGRDVGINLTAVRSYAHQIFVGLNLLKKCNILHADLKPDNILVDEGRKHLKICDLGSAGDASENDATPYLVSRFYRAPEIILGMRFDFAIDMWSIGCTLYELYTGKILFTGRSNNQMLRMMMECRGKFSIKMLKKAEYAGLHFEDSGVFRSLERDKITGKDVVRMLTFNTATRDLKARLLSSAKGLAPEELKELNLFADLLDKCLHLNPEKRITPLEALKHPFISRAKVGGHSH